MLLSAQRAVVTSLAWGMGNGKTRKEVEKVWGERTPTAQVRTPPAELRTTPAETMKVRTMLTCTTRRDGGIGPHAHGNAARHVVDDLTVEGSGQQKLYNDSCNNQLNPSMPTTGFR